jgi:hypothetical protein
MTDKDINRHSYTSIHEIPHYENDRDDDNDKSNTSLAQNLPKYNESLGYLPIKSMLLYANYSKSTVVHLNLLK